MGRHLVTIEVGVISRADQGVKLNSLALDQDGFEGLDAETVQGRGPVQHYGMLFDDILEDIPNLGLYPLYLLLGALDVLGLALGNELLHNEGLEKLKRHGLGQTALPDLQGRSDTDNGPAGVIDTLAQEVLPETAALTFEHVGQGLQRPVAGTGDRPAAAPVVDQGVNGFLQHPLLVSDDDLGGSKVKETAKTVISIDNSSIQIVQVGGGETAAVQLNHGAEIRRDDRDDVQDHPLGLVSGLAESLYDLQPLDDAGPLLTGSVFQLAGEFSIFLLQVDCLQKLLDGLCAHAGPEGVSVLVAGIIVLSLGKNLLVGKVRSLTGIQYDIGCEIEDSLQGPGADVQD